MNRRLKEMCIAAAFLAGCSASSDTSTPDGITADELRAGASFDGKEAEDENDPAFADDSPVEDDGIDAGSSPGADDDAGTDGVGTQNVSTLNTPTSGSCTHAAGYRQGSPMSICVTTIDGKPVESATAAAFLQMRAAAAHAGVNIHVVSGFRTMAEQRHLYALYKAGRGNLAAPPGYSNHQSGHALDLNSKASGVYSWLSHHGAAYGFRRTVPSEQWHWEHW
jgi:hypothetical protein